MISYLFVLLAVLGFAVYDYLHTRPNWTLKSNWLKYVVGLATGLFVVTITSIPIIKDLAYAGATVLACMLSGVIYKWVIGLFGKSTTTTVGKV